MKSKREQNLERIIFFSDAVIAIAITLLVLDLHLPEGRSSSLSVQLLHLYPKFISFFVSFAVIGLFWEAHHRLFGYIKDYDRGLIWLNLLFLFFIAFIPFPTSVMGNNWSGTSAIFYAGTLIFTGLARAAIWRHAVRRRLIEENLAAAVVKTETWRGITVPVVFLISIPFAMRSPTLASICWILLVPISTVGRRRIAKAT
jgi:uncharacterized membrane protein